MHLANPIALQGLSRWMAGTVLLIGLAVLGLGWGLGLEPLRRILPGLPAMVPSTALGLVTLAVAQLWQLARPRAHLPAALALAVTLYAAGNIALSYLPGAGTLPDDRMSRATALGLILAGVGLILLPPRPRWGWYGPTALTCGICLAVIAIEGYAFDPAVLNRSAVFSAMSLHTAVTLLLLDLSILIGHPDSTWVGTLCGRRSGSAVARRLLPLAVLGPIAVSYLAYGGTELGLIDPNLRLSSFAVALAALAGVAVLRTAYFRNAAEARAEAEELRLRQVLDGLEVAVFVLDPDGALRLCNRRAERYADRLATPRDWLFGDHFHSLNDRQKLDGERHPVPRLLAPGGEDQAFVGWVDPRGEEHVLHLTMSRPAGGALSILSVLDETQGWRLRENLSRSERLDAIGQMSGGIAHEMANIFGVVQLSADTGVLSGASTGARRQFEAIRKACRRGADLTNRLLHLTREPVSDGKPVEIATLVAETLELARQSVPAHIELEQALTTGPALVACSTADIETAVLNLVLNAGKAIEETGRTGTIRVALEGNGERVVLRVRDDGPGMSPEVLRRAREPFFTTRRANGGSGLGLAMIDMLAQRMGGRFDIASTPGQGTEAELTLPLVTASDLPDTPDGGEMPLADLAGISVLVVEDDPQFHDILADALALLGAQVERATTGRAALDLLRGGLAPDILLTDVILPGGMGGYAVATAAEEIRPEMRVIYLTGYTEQLNPAERKVPGLMLRKPVRLGELTHTIRLVLDQPALRPDRVSRS